MFEVWNLLTSIDPYSQNVVYSFLYAQKNTKCPNKFIRIILKFNRFPINAEFKVFYNRNIAQFPNV